MTKDPKEKTKQPDMKFSYDGSRGSFVLGLRSWVKNFWKGWMAFVKILGNFNSRLILTLFYFLIVGLFSLLVGRWQNYLRRRSPSDTNWLPVASKTMDLSDAKRQF